MRNQNIVKNTTFVLIFFMRDVLEDSGNSWMKLLLDLL